MINLFRQQKLNINSKWFKKHEYLFNIDYWDSEIECFDSLNKTSDTNAELGVPTPMNVGNELSMCYE